MRSALAGFALLILVGCSGGETISGPDPLQAVLAATPQPTPALQDATLQVVPSPTPAAASSSWPAPKLIAPQGVVSQDPTFTWAGVRGASAYRVQISVNGSEVSTALYAAASVCGGTVCSVSSRLRTPDSYTWTARVEGATVGAWAEPLAFTVAP